MGGLVVRARLRNTDVVVYAGEIELRLHRGDDWVQRSDLVPD